MSDKLKTLPRWLIFILDLCGITVALLLSRIVSNNFNLHHAWSNLTNIFAVALPINAVLFYLFKSYSGIIRYTTIRDTFRLVAITACSSILYLITAYFYYDSGIFELSKATILINFFVVSSGLIGYRMVVRYCYKIFFTDGLLKNSTRTVVYDSSEQGLLTKRVINDYPQNQMIVTGFLDDRPNTFGKRMEGLPIYPVEEGTFKRLAEEKVKLIIVANKAIPAEKLNTLVDFSLKYGIRLRQVPPISQWLKGKLDSEQLKNINIEDLLEREVIRIHNENIFYALKGKKILVTGAAGSIGSEIVRQLTQFKPSLIILCDKAETPMHELSVDS